MKEGCTTAAVNFLISDQVKCALIKHKKSGTESTVNSEEDQDVDRHDKSFKYWLFIYLHV